MRTTSESERAQRGITLIELLVTLSIAVVTLTVGVAAFRELVADTRMTTAVNDLIASMQLARSEAVRRGERVTLCPDDPSTANTFDCSGGTDWTVGYIVFADSNSDGVVADQGDVIRKIEEIPASISITSGSRTRITFQADGSSAGFNTTFSVCDQGGSAQQRAVILSDTGRAYTSLGGGSCGDDDDDDDDDGIDR